MGSVFRFRARKGPKRPTEWHARWNWEHPFLLYDFWSLGGQKILNFERKWSVGGSQNFQKTHHIEKSARSWAEARKVLLSEKIGVLQNLSLRGSNSSFPAPQFFIHNSKNFALTIPPDFVRTAVLALFRAENGKRRPGCFFNFLFRSFWAPKT